MDRGAAVNESEWILLPASAPCACKAHHLTLDPCYIGAGCRESAVLDLSRWPDSAAYAEAAMKEYAKSVRYPTAKAVRLGYGCREFGGAAHNAEINEINTSMEVRQGRPMSEGYRKPLWVPERLQTEAPDPKSCPEHYRTMFGAFAPATREQTPPGHPIRRGGGPMRGYISFIRSGPLGIYSRILSHGAHRQDGFMRLLHFFAVAHAYAGGIRYLLYGGWNDGLEGLRQWKEHLFFAPRRMRLDQELGP